MDNKNERAQMLTDIAELTISEEKLGAALDGAMTILDIGIDLVENLWGVFVDLGYDSPELSEAVRQFTATATEVIEANLGAPYSGYNQRE